MPYSDGLFTAFSRCRAALLVALVFVGYGFGQTDAGRISAIESDTDRWIELQSQIAKSKNDWKNERLLLGSSIEILEAEQATLIESIASNEQASGVYVANRDRIKRRVVEQRDSLAGLKEPLRALESELKVLLPRLPSPLRQEVQSHLAKVDAESASVASRAQSLVSSLTAIDRFSNSLTIKRVVRPGPDGGEVSVRVLYWGLAVAYGVDVANGRAWMIRPGGSGWEWQPRDEIFAEVLELVESYENRSDDPRLIALPASLS